MAVLAICCQMVSIFFSQRMIFYSKNNDLFSNDPEYFKTFNFKKPKVPEPQAAEYRNTEYIHVVTQSSLCILIWVYRGEECGSVCWNYTDFFRFTF